MSRARAVAAAVLGFVLLGARAGAQPPEAARATEAADARAAAPDAASEEAPGAGAQADTAAARAPVERLYAALGDVMGRADALGFEGRRAALEPVVAQSYDVAFMAQLILGAEWKRLTPEQRERWIETFTRFTVATYADRFDGPRVRFEIGAVQPAGGGTRLVRTKLHRRDDEPVELDYRVRAANGGWRIVDVYLSGTVSELALRRSEYAALLKREGFDALLAAMERKIAAAKAGTAEQAGAP